MVDVRQLREGENPPTGSSWILIESDGPVWIVNSATFVGDEVPSDPLGPFHTLRDAVNGAVDLAAAAGIETVYVRGAD